MKQNLAEECGELKRAHARSELRLQCHRDCLQNRKGARAKVNETTAVKIKALERNRWMLWEKRAAGAPSRASYASSSKSRVEKMVRIELLVNVLPHRRGAEDGERGSGARRVAHRRW